MICTVLSFVAKHMSDGLATNTFRPLTRAANLTITLDMKVQLAHRRGSTADLTAIRVNQVGSLRRLRSFGEVDEMQSLLQHSAAQNGRTIFLAR